MTATAFAEAVCPIDADRAEALSEAGWSWVDRRITSYEAALATLADPGV